MEQASQIAKKCLPYARNVNEDDVEHVKCCAEGIMKKMQEHMHAMRSYCQWIKVE